MVRIRRLAREDIDEVAALTARAFGKDAYEEAFTLAKAAALHCPFMPIELGMGVEVDGRIVAKWQLVDLCLRLGVARLRVAGAFAIAVEPGYQGQALLARFVEEGRQLVAELGYPLLLGFAQRGGAYALLGAATVCAEYEWSVDALRLPILRDDPFRALAPSDVPRLVELYNASNESRPGSLVRSVEQWPWLLRRPPTVLVSDDGYLGLRDEAGGVELRELGYRDPRFVRLALSKLGQLARERNVRRVFGHVPLDHPLVAASRAYGGEVRVRFPHRAGVMAGIVQVESFLEQLAPELARRLAQSRHAGRGLELTLVIDGFEHHVSLAGDTDAVRTIRVALTQQELVQMAFGYRSAASVLYARGDELPENDVEILEALFPAAHPWVWHTDRF